MEHILSDMIFDPRRFAAAAGALALALAAGLLTGPVAGRAVPALWALTDVVFGGVGGRLDRLQRRKADLVLRGAGFCLVVIVLFLMLGGLAADLAGRYGLYGLAEPLLLALCLAGGAPWRSLIRLYRALKRKGGAKGGFYAVARSARMDFSASDDFGITRAGVGWAARSFDKGAVAPVFWYLVGGLPLAFLYAGLAALAWRFGKDGFTKGFGALPLALERLAGWIPSLIAAFLLALAALFTPTAMMSRALKGLFSGKGRQPYAEGGAPVTAMAWALDVSLGGPAMELSGSSMPRAWSGPPGATARLESGHLRRALYISAVAHVLLLAVLVGALVVAGNLGG